VPEESIGHEIGQPIGCRSDEALSGSSERVEAYPSSAKAAALVYVSDLNQPQIEPGDLHHLVKVLRLGPKEPLILADREGHWRLATLESVLASSEGGKSGLGPMQWEPVRRYPVRVGMVPLKGDRTERALRQLTEIGVDEVVLYHSRRSIVRWGPSEERQRLERYRRILEEAGMQSRRARLPALTSLLGQRDGVRAAASYAQGEVVIAQPGSPSFLPGLAVDRLAVDRLAVDRLAVEQSRALFLVGPEGGFEDSELREAKLLLGLGPTVLRAETAVVALASRLVWFSELNESIL